MNFPELTLTYLAVLALLYSVLALIVVALRAKNNIPFGDGGNESLHRAIRAHGNFIEWVPLASLLVASVEALGEPRLLIHLLMGALLIARVLHPIAFASKLGSAPYLVGRITGALTSWAVLTAAAVFLLVRL
jgi:uncharacterized membrane protein YecN with MAPEG domain